MALFLLHQYARNIKQMKFDKFMLYLSSDVELKMIFRQYNEGQCTIIMRGMVLTDERDLL